MLSRSSERWTKTREKCKFSRLLHSAEECLRKLAEKKKGEREKSRENRMRNDIGFRMVLIQLEWASSERIKMFSVKSLVVARICDTYISRPWICRNSKWKITEEEKEEIEENGFKYLTHLAKWSRWEIYNRNPRATSTQIEKKAEKRVRFMSM